jgi:hypothetical protein
VELFILLHPDAESTYYRISIPGETSAGPGATTDRVPRVWGSLRARLDQSEMARLHPAIAKRIGGQPGFLGAIKYKGPLRFDRDVWEPLSYSHAALASRFFAALESGNADAIEALTDVPFAFDRKAVFYDKEELMQRFRAIPEQTRGKAPRVEILRSEPVEHYAFTDEFHKRFAEEHMPRRSSDMVATLSVNGEKMLLLVRLVRQDEHSIYRIAGFSH